MSATRDGLFMALGAAIGAVATYFVMEYVHEKEIGEILSSQETYEELVEEYTGSEDDGEVATIHPIKKDTRYTEVTPTHDAHEEDGVIYTAPVEEDDESTVDYDSSDEQDVADEQDSTDGDEVEGEGEPEEQVDTASFDGIVIIDSEMVSGRQIVGKYDHDNGSFEVNPTLSIKTEGLFDEHVENDELMSLIGEEAWDKLMESEPQEDIRLLCVRNNVINLDFVINY